MASHFVQFPHQLYSVFPSGTPQPGTLLQLGLPPIFDLFRALFPVVHSTELSLSASAVARFSNSCIFLSEGVGSLGTSLDDAQARERMEESKERMQALGENMLDLIVVSFCIVVFQCLTLREVSRVSYFRLFRNGNARVYIRC